MRFYPFTSAGCIRHISRFLDALSLYSLLDRLTSIFANIALIQRHNVCLYDKISNW